MRSNIIRFDNISKVVPRDTYIDCSYKFKEIKIRNTAGSYNFMDAPFQDIDIYFYDKELPIEVAVYDTVKEFTDVKIDGNKIQCGVDRYALDSVVDVFVAIGFKEERPLLWDISGTLDKTKIYFELRERKDISTFPINAGGYNCPCFLVKDVGTLFKTMAEKRNIKVSSIEPLFVNNRLLDVGFMRIHGFELVLEFISLRRNSKRKELKHAAKCI